MRDPHGIVPPSIKANYERAEMVDRHMKAAISLCAALKAMDDRLDIEFISEGADPEWGVKPGRWHVVRKNPPPAPDSFIPIETPEGEYMEPHSGVLRDLQERDLWKHGTPDNFDKPAALKETQRKLQDEQRVDELAADIRAGLRLPGDGGLTKKLWGKGGLKGVVGS